MMKPYLDLTLYNITLYYKQGWFNFEEDSTKRNPYEKDDPELDDPIRKLAWHLGYMDHWLANYDKQAGNPPPTTPE